MINFQRRPILAPAINPETLTVGSNLGFQVPEDDPYDDSDDCSPVEQPAQISRMPVETLRKPVESTGSTSDVIVIPDNISDLPSNSKLSSLLKLQISSNLNKSSMSADISGLSDPHQELRTKTTVIDLVSEVRKSAAETDKIMPAMTREPSVSYLGKHDLGSSQVNPIDLVGKDSAEKCRVTITCDDKGPEGLQITPYFVRRSSDINTTDDPQYPNVNVAEISVSPQVASNNSQASPEGVGHQQQIEAASFIADSETGYSDVEVEYSTSSDDHDPSLNAKGFTDVHTHRECLYDISDTRSNNIHGQPKNGNAPNVIPEQQAIIARFEAEYPPSNNATGCQSPQSEQNQPSSILVEDSQLQGEWHPAKHYSYACALSYSDYYQQNLDLGASTQRAPSPSDAALVKPLQTSKMRPTYDDGGNDLPLSKQPKQQSFLGTHSEEDGSVLDGPTTTHKTSVPWTDTAQSTESLAYPTYSSDHCVEYMDRYLPRYEDGPFAGWRYDLSSDGPPHRSLSTCSYKRICQYADFGYEPGHYEQPCTNINGWQKYSSNATHVHPNSEPWNYRSQETSESLERADTKCSKLPISDIVNEPSNNGLPAVPHPDSIGDSPRKLKRKYEKLDSLELNTSAAQLYATNNPALMNDVSYLTESIQTEEKTLNEATLPDTTDHQKSIPLDTLRPLKEPVRKKSKPNPRPTQPIKAFVSGILVGCVSLMGFCAAFVATIPDVIRDEARTEI